MGRTRTVSVEVEVDLWDISDREMIEELKERGYAVVGSPKDKSSVLPECEGGATLPVPEDLLEEVKMAISEGRRGDAIAVLDRLLVPRWKTVSACATAYEQARKTAA